MVVMKLLTPRLRKALHHKRLSSSTGAIAGLISAVSVIVGTLAAYAAPRGWHKVALALHFAKKPLILQIAPVIAGAAVTVATFASLLKFLSWCLESDTENDAEPPADMESAASDSSLLNIATISAGSESSDGPQDPQYPA
jgi:hypothetical protein